MKDNLILKKILNIIAVPVLGFILLNLAFIFDALYQTILFKLFPIDYNSTMYWFPIFKHLSFVVIIIIISWFILKSKLKDLYKAIYSIVPIAVIFVTVGIFFNQWPVVVYILGILIYGAIILYLYKNNKSWIFYYSTTLVALTLLIMVILRVDI